MLKFLLILGIVFYLIYKVSGFLTKGLFATGQRRAAQNQARNKSKVHPSDGNVDVDYIPKDRKKDSFKGGDYVDYEEVD